MAMGLRAWMFALLALLVAEPGAAQGYHVPVRGVFTPDAATVVVGWSDGSLTRSRVGAGAVSPLARLADEGSLKALAVSPDGRRLAAASSGSVEVFEMATGTSLIRVKVKETPKSLWLSGDRLLVRGDDASALYDLVTGARIAELEGGDETAPGFVGDRVITFTNRHLLVWTLTGGAVADIPTGLVTSAVPIGEGRLLASTYDGMQVIEVAAGKAVADPDKRKGARELTVLAPNRILGSDADAWRLYDSLGREIQAPRSAPGGSAFGEAYAVGARHFARWREDGAIEVIDAATGTPREAVRLSEASGLLAVSPDGQWALTWLAGGVAHLYALDDGRLGGCLSLANDPHRCAVAAAIVAFSADAKLDTARALIAAVQTASPTELEPNYWNLVADSHHYLAAASLLLERDDLAGAQSAYEWLLGNPDEGLLRSARLRLSDIIIARGGGTAAAEVLKPLIEAMRRDPASRLVDCPLCQALDTLGQVYLAAGNDRLAQAAAVEASASLGRHPDLDIAMRVRSNYAAILESQSRWLEAETVRSRLLQIEDEDAQPSEVTVAQQKLAIAESLAHRGQTARGDLLAGQAVAALAQHLDANHPYVLDGRERLGRLRLDALDQPLRALDPLRAAASALALGGARTAKPRFDRFRAVFRVQVAADWAAAQATGPEQAPRPPPADIRHRAAVGVLAASPDGAMIASGDEDGLVIAWNLASGASAARFKFDRPIRALSFLAGGGGLAIATDGATVLALKSLGGQPLGARDPELARPIASYGRTSVTFGRDGRVVGRRDKVWRTEVSADGSAVAYGADNGDLCVSNLATGRQTCGNLGKSTISAIAFDPDGRSILTASAYEPVLKLTVATLEETRRSPLKGAEQAKSAAISPDGRFAAVGNRIGQIRVLDWRTGAERFELEGHIGSVNALAFLPDGRMLSAGEDGRVVVWDLEQGRAVAALGASSFGAGHAKALVSVALSVDGARAVTTSADRTVRTWDAASGEQLAVERVTSETAMARFLPGGRLAVIGYDVSVRDLEGGSPVALGLTGDSRRVVAWPTPAHAVVYDDDDDHYDVVNLDRTPKTVAIPAPRHPVDAVLTSDGVGLAILDREGSVTLVNGVTGLPIRQLMAEGGRDIIMVGETLLVHAGVGLLRFDGRSGAALPEGDSKACGGLRLYGRSLSGGQASGPAAFVIWGAGDPCIFDAAGRLVTVLDGVQFRTAYSAAALSADGGAVAIGLLDGGVVIADARSGAIRSRLEGHSGTITALAFSADGERLISGSEDRTARVWDARRGALLATLGE